MNKAIKHSKNQNSKKMALGVLNKDYQLIMQGFINTPVFQQVWKKNGDFYEQYSIYNQKAVTVSGIL